MSKEFDEWYETLDLDRYTIRDLAFTAYGRGRADETHLQSVVASARSWPGEHSPTMHPDLVWLAFRPVSDFKLNCDRSKVLGFYRLNDKVAVALRSSDGSMPASIHPPVFSLTTIEQARKQLAEPTEKPEIKWSTQMIQNGNMQIRGEVVPSGARILSELGLNNLPDYEKWFKIHGTEGTVKYQTHPVREATVDELYTMFRARLLDELHQAGVLARE